MQPSRPNMCPHHREQEEQAQRESKIFLHIILMTIQQHHWYLILSSIVHNFYLKHSSIVSRLSVGITMLLTLVYELYAAQCAHYTQ